MQAGANRPEELDTLLEDAFVMRDPRALAALFEDAAVLGTGDRSPVAHGRRQIVQAAAEMWAREELYLAYPRRVLQARRTALIAGDRSISVARRSTDGIWRYTIALLHAQPQSRRSTR
jgi:hypothetical protein